MATRKKQLDFEDKIEQLETLVEELEEGNLGLEDALKSFEKGVKLTRECQLALQNAEQRIRVLEKQDDGGVIETTFAGENDE
ncbi:MAG TPA: exodeoxyribonuclease VII small subunit [Porticoccaceae bacterium]|nr:exodeoxyribonuclease VII small subunit [Porticoccaceae bacterium]HCO61453.1 exodeoxyribonuclease VII small subunit [Porticoccaceae bacterium]